MAAASLPSAQKAVELLDELENEAGGASFSGSRVAFDMAVTGLRGYLGELGEGSQAPATMREAIRVSQAVSSLSDAVRDRSRDVRKLQQQVESLADAQARTKAWATCLELEFQCSRLFADYLDLVSGIALRASGRDDGLCRIADALISDFDPFGTTSWGSLTVPASRELREDPIASFVRLGFPEWSVWTLPLAMVDFSSYLILEHRKTASLRSDAAEQIETIAAKRPRIPDAAFAAIADRRRGLPTEAGHRAELRKASFNRLAGMLVLESLATAIMGPAYAWAALLMRVEPRPVRRSRRAASPQRGRRDAAAARAEGPRGGTA